MDRQLESFGPLPSANSTSPADRNWSRSAGWVIASICWVCSGCVAGPGSPGGVAAGPTGSITGYVYNDANDNGNRDNGEVGLPGREVYLDTNKDGIFEAGEPFAVTNSSGQYSFMGLAPGPYEVRQIVPPGFIQTQPLNAYVTETLQVKAGVTTEADFGTYPLIPAGNLDNAKVAFTVTASNIQSDGKLLVAGYMGSMNAGGAQSIVARYNPDGSPDRTFGVNGQVVQTVGHQSTVTGMAIDPSNGDIIVVGNYDINLTTGQCHSYVERFTPTGARDPTLFQMSYGAAFDPAAKTGGNAIRYSKVLLTAGGHIVVTGEGDQDNGQQIVPKTGFQLLVAYNKDGSLDKSFGAAPGYTITPTGDDLSPAQSLTSPDGGSIYVSGTLQQFVLMRFNGKGIKQSTGQSNFNFSATGDSRPVSALAHAATIQLDGKIVVVGELAVQDYDKLEPVGPPISSFAVVRFNADGSLDNSFGDRVPGGKDGVRSGMDTTHFGSTKNVVENDVADSVAIDSDGTILVLGIATQGGTTTAIEVTYVPDGALLAKVGGKGKIVIGPASPNAPKLFVHPTVAAISGPGWPFISPISSAPSASLTKAPDPSTVRVTFEITYKDAKNINYRTIQTGNVLVTGPNFSQLSTWEGIVNPQPDKTAAVAQYSNMPASGAFLAGTYQIKMEANQVSNGSLCVPPGPLGSFTIKK